MCHNHIACGTYIVVWRLDPQHSPLLRKEIKTIGITIFLHGCFKAVWGGICSIVMGPVHPIRETSGSNDLQRVHPFLVSITTTLESSTIWLIWGVWMLWRTEFFSFLPSDKPIRDHVEMKEAWKAVGEDMCYEAIPRGDSEDRRRSGSVTIETR